MCPLYIREARSWSIWALAEEFGVDRRTVKRRVEGTPPGAFGGVAVAEMDTPVANDPDELHLTYRLSHYCAAREDQMGGGAEHQHPDTGLLVRSSERVN